MSGTDSASEENLFLELRRKVRHSEVLSAAVERLLRNLHFSGRLSVVVHNGRVLKTGYEEGYFSHRGELRRLEGANPPLPVPGCEPSLG